MEILEVRIQAARPAELRRFYAESLGLPVSSTGGGAVEGFTVAIGGSTLAVDAVDAADAGGPPVYHLAFIVPADALAAGKAWVAERTPLLTDPDGRTEFRFDDWRATSAYFADPAGNILELIAWDTPVGDVGGDLLGLAPLVGDPHDAVVSGGPSAATGGGPFGPADLLAVGEVGVVVPDVAGTVARLGEAGFAPYNDDWSPEFAPVGDPAGRLIVVPPGRPWFPVGLPAVAAPLAVTLRGARRDAFALPGTRTTITVEPRPA